jgi:hypothetical protein
MTVIKCITFWEREGESTDFLKMEAAGSSRMLITTYTASTEKTLIVIIISMGIPDLVPRFYGDGDLNLQKPEEKRPRHSSRG